MNEPLKFGCPEDFGNYPVSWTLFYFHGYIETHLGWVQSKHGWKDSSDLVAGKMPPPMVPNGIHDCKVYGMDCKLFKWADNRGLIVAADRTLDMSYAQQKYDIKAVCL